MSRMIESARRVAKSRGIMDNIQLSTRNGKRFMIKVGDKWIHFGAWPAQTFLDHNNAKIREAWRARHSKIMRRGKPAYLDRESPEYYSWNILW